MKLLPKNESGFSLLEILIALTLMSIVMTSVYVMIDQGFDTKDNVLSDDREIMQIYMALDRFGRDFSEIHLPAYYERVYKAEKGKPTPKVPSSRYAGMTVSRRLIPNVFSEGPNQLTFLSKSNRRKLEETKESHFVWLHYTIRQMDEKDYDDIEINKDAGYELIRYYAPYDLYEDEFDWENIKPQVLLYNVSELKFSFWNTEKKEWVDSITLLNQNPFTGISAVRMNLKVVTTQGEEFKIERIYRSNLMRYDFEHEDKTYKKPSTSTPGNPSTSPTQPTTPNIPGTPSGI